ncbi:MAG TPA: hypothetical protein VGK29_11045 [Paludibaculum sp.]|jgi:hypothetical protein
MSTPPAISAHGLVPPEDARAQLAKVLASTHFKNSRRCSALLEYVVEAACDGRSDALKERVVGCAVFGRHADYDTNQDAVVRNAAAEVRKRLAQYYLEADHAHEVRIELPAGSYLPVIYLPFNSVAPAPPAPARSAWIPAAMAVAGVGILGIAVALLFHNRQPSPTDLDLFWTPVIESPGVAQICIGQTGMYYAPGVISSEIPPRPHSLEPMRDRFVYMGDAIAMTRLSGYLYSRGKECRYRGAMTTPYSELRGNPVVLIGMFNNQWTLRLTEHLRYQLNKDDAHGLIRVRDSQGPVEFPYARKVKDSIWNNEADYSVITRVFDQRTERWVIAAGGVTQHGTMATGDFLSKPEYFRQAVRNAPADWARKNMQVVIETKVEGGTPGPPKVLATYFW